MKGNPPSRPRGILLVVLVCVGWLFVTEMMIRLLLPRPGFRPFDSDEIIGLKVPHPVRGFSYASNFSGRRTTADYENEVTTNALGLRERPIELDNSKEVRLLAVGDSFTEGLGVNYVDAWPAQLELLMNSQSRSGRPIRVINAGIAAYSLRQIRLMTGEMMPLLQPSVVMVGVYVEGVGRIDNPYVFLNGQTVLSSKLPNLRAVSDGFLYSPFHTSWAVSIDLWLDQYFHTGAYLAKVFRAVRRIVETPTAPTVPQITLTQARQNLSKLLKEIDLIKELSEVNRTNLVILLINHQEGNGTFSSISEMYNTVINESCRERGIPVVDILPQLVRASAGRPVFRFKRDGHWTPAAHKIAAKSMARLLIDSKLISSPPPFFANASTSARQGITPSFLNSEAMYP